MFKYKKHLIIWSISAVCAVLSNTVFHSILPSLVVYASEEPETKPEKIEVEEEKQWNVADSCATSKGPASSILILQPQETEETNTDKEWQLLLVNKEHPLPDGYQPDTKRLSNGLMVDERIYEPLMEMLEAGNQEGCALMVCSAYRPYEKQVELYQRDIIQYQRWGYSYEEACAITEETLAVPGCSEHQAGLSVDIVTVRHQVLNEAFADTKAGQWLAAHAHEYGFILRYPKEKEELTEISYEPWHFRYVGVEAAEEIYNLGCCLEEYVQQEQPPLLELFNLKEEQKEDV